MKTFQVGRIVPILAPLTLASGLDAQVAQVKQDAVTLKNWSAPPYWQPARADSEAAGEVRAEGPQVATPAGALVFVAMPICRVVDTRAAYMFLPPFGAPSLMPGTVRNFPLQTSPMCPIPATAQAYSLNVTVVPPGTLGYLIIWPTDKPSPTP